jgi:protein-disulfide isomerase
MWKKTMNRESSNRSASIVVLLAGLLICAAGFVSAQGNPPQARPKTSSSTIDFHALKTVGSKSAPITFEVFSDYQCPACKAFFLTTTEQIVKDYVSTGKVYIVHHDYPWSFHAHSLEAAKWANAAAGIGKFHEVETVLYSTQDSWETSGKVEDAVTSVLSAADLKRVQALLGKPEIQTSINQDMDLAKQRNINETPSIFVTYKGQMTQVPYKGATYGFLKQYFDYLLSH